MAVPEVHESPIRTPKQLIIVVVLAFAVPIIIAALLSHLAAGGMKVEEASLNPQAVTERIRPVASVEVGAPEVKGERTGEQIVKSTCSACHATGAAGAPKIGDKAAWAKHFAEGQAHAVHNAITGIRAMPPRGGNPDLTDVEVERAVVFMVNQSGGSFREPAAKGAAKGPANAAKK
jgi:cytochrome c5